MHSHIRTGICGSMMFAAALTASACRKSGTVAPEIRYLPTPSAPCLSSPLPVRPTLYRCPPDTPQCDDANLATLIDYVLVLERFGKTAVALCGDPKKEAAPVAPVSAPVEPPKPKLPAGKLATP